MTKANVQPGTTVAPDSFRIEIKPDGPYLVYGRPPLRMQTITLNQQGECWSMTQGREFTTEKEPTALCRCGASKNRPYCDGSHAHTAWDPTLTASEDPILENSEVFENSQLRLYDNDAYCVFARFCDAKGRIWNLMHRPLTPQTRETIIHEAEMCPGGRLNLEDKQTGERFEPKYDPSLGLIEDPATLSSGGLWVRGGIPVARQSDSFTYEIRNRTVLCRCGASGNKPFCDGTHAAIHFKDGL
ncbi:MAG: CDGSH iron-sulfur domain-containing protein [Tidjanibacter sp.]|nr:CDGSH iron-sulfur domain-containing protein [Tidjanibacter sp.]